MLQLVFSTYPATGEMTEIFLKLKDNQIWKRHNPQDFFALISQSIIFWKTLIDYTSDP